MMGSLSGGLATMGSGMPYAVAAKFAHPDRPVVAICGDGAMQMNGMNELITVAKYWRQWSDPRLVVLVLNNRDLNQVTWEQRVLAGDPKFLGSQSLPDLPYHRYAELLGLRGIVVDDPDRVGPAWDEAFSADRPVVVEFRADPNVPPLPPHITLNQARAFVSSMVGEPELGSVLRNTARQVVASLLPGSSSAPKREDASEKS
jgi:pyruvate dehydrogenase (quinone)